MTLTGSAGRAIRATAVSSTVATLALDLDGNGSFERSATLAWLELSTTSGADLADDDNDGMHNGWEDAKGLNRNDAADAALDPDGDTFTNLQEYQAGTLPNDAASFPLTGPGPGSGSDPAPIAFSGLEIPLAGVSDLVYDAVSQKTVRSGARRCGQLRAASCRSTRSTALSAPRSRRNMQPSSKIAVSDDGQYLYVSRRFDGSGRPCSASTSRLPPPRSI